MKINKHLLSVSNLRKLRKKGFTLVELLIVVVILAIIGGALLAAYDGLTTNATQGTATNTIASLNQTTRIYYSIEKKLPNNLETLLAATVVAGDLTYDAAAADSVATNISSPAFAQFIPSVLDTGASAKLRLVELTNAELNNLRNSGITNVRYLDAGAEAPANLPYDTPVPAATGGDAIINGPVSLIDIPAQAFDAPRPGARNRGRGFSYLLPTPTANDNAGSGVSLAVWSTTPVTLTGNPNAYDNAKVGASATAKLVALGIGDYSSLVRNTPAGATKYLTSAPMYANVGKEEYNHYIALIDVRQNPARLVNIVDTRGDFVQEEFAETFDQKL